MHLGIGGTIVLLVLSLIFKTNFFAMLGGGHAGPARPPVVSRPNPVRDAAEKPLVQFVSFVLDDAQKTWTGILPEQAGKQYHHARLVLFRNYTRSGCGSAESATGPFYCPQDERVYIDLGFYNELKSRFGATGEFAQAYVLAHELGHHVQNILGIERKLRQLQEQNPREQKPLSVKMELQADCFAGIWAHSTQERGILEQGDIQSALSAASAVGDDRLQKMATGHVNPDSFTHGSSQQRMMWFRKGFDSGSITACNTFGQ
jgi:predicted metalloprotease